MLSYFYKLCNSSSDINEHLETLLDYGKQCQHITEFGTRWATSSIALALANPIKFITYDIIKHANSESHLKLIESYCKENKILFEFKLADVLSTQMEETDLLFIDTLHTYNQLTLELEKHGDSVRKFIILHDTTHFGHVDEHVYNHASSIIKKSNKNKTGLKNAIKDFIEKFSTFEIIEEFTNNNGLTILGRK